jgi:hypothetical protein
MKKLLVFLWAFCLIAAAYADDASSDTSTSDDADLYDSYKYNDAKASKAESRVSSEYTVTDTDSDEATSTYMSGATDEDIAEIVGTTSFATAYGDSGSAKYYGSKIAALEEQKKKYKDKERYPGVADIIDAKIAAVKKQAESERATGTTSSTTSTSTSDNEN